MTDNTDKCLTLVPPIHAAYQQSVSALKGSFEYALECGDLLNRAKETVGKGWLKWLETHCSFISKRTAADYMRVAKAKEEGVLKEEHLDTLAAEGWSIRAVIGLLPKRTRKPSEATEPEGETEDEGEPASETEAVPSNTANAITSAQPSPDLTAMVENVGPDEVFKALTDAGWSGEQLQALSSLIDDYLQPPQAQAA